MSKRRVKIVVLCEDSQQEILVGSPGRKSTGSADPGFLQPRYDYFGGLSGKERHCHPFPHLGYRTFERVYRKRLYHRRSTIEGTEGRTLL